MTIGGEQFGDPVLEPFASAVRERQVVGIGADAKRRPRRSSRAGAVTTTALRQHHRRAQRVASPAASQREHVEHAAARRRGLQVREHAAESVAGGRIARVEIVADDRPGPAADARQHRHVLAAVGPLVDDRLADDARSRT